MFALPAMLHLQANILVGQWGPAVPVGSSGAIFNHLTLSGLSIDGSDLDKSFQMMTF